MAAADEATVVRILSRDEASGGWMRLRLEAAPWSAEHDADAVTLVLAKRRGRRRFRALPGSELDDDRLLVSFELPRGARPAAAELRLVAADRTTWAVAEDEAERPSAAPEPPTAAGAKLPIAEPEAPGGAPETLEAVLETASADPELSAAAAAATAAASEPRTATADAQLAELRAHLDAVTQTSAALQEAQRRMQNRIERDRERLLAALEVERETSARERARLEEERDQAIAQARRAEQLIETLREPDSD